MSDRQRARRPMGFVIGPERLDCAVPECSGKVTMCVPLDDGTLGFLCAIHADWWESIPLSKRILPREQS